MRPIHLRWLVISSIGIGIALTAHAATRPRYGGTLRVETHAAISSLDTAQPIASSDTGVRDSIVPLVFDTLVRLDANGAPQPQLALRWQADNGNKRWQLWLRRGVLMHDGSSLTPSVVAQSLTSSLAGFTVRATADGVIVESAAATPGMLAELSLPQNAIMVRGSDGTVVGSGPFRIAEFQSGRRLLLRANEDYWNGRPYLDMVDITFGQSLRDQAIHYQLGRADVIELAPDQVRRATQDNRRVASSSPSELIAIVVPHGTGAAEDPRMREALSLATDRGTIQNVLLQRQGDPTAALLPQWISGYAFLFPTTTDVSRARQLRAELASNQPAIPLAYDPLDTIARMIAERIAVNARDAGILVQPVSQSALATQSAPRIVCIRLNSSNAQAALADAVAAIDPAQVARVLSTKTAEDLYQTERAVLDDFRVIPIAHIPQSFVLSQRVHDWSMDREGNLPLDNVWVEAGQ
jgi:peptide/nickel transport system substrate-binding protein